MSLQLNLTLDLGFTDPKKIKLDTFTNYHVVISTCIVLLSVMTSSLLLQLHRLDFSITVPVIIRIKYNTYGLI